MLTSTEGEFAVVPFCVKSGAHHIAMGSIGIRKRVWLFELLVLTGDGYWQSQAQGYEG